MSDRQIPLRALLLLFVLSGAAGLIYEVVWARQLVLVFGNTSQAVSTILTGFFGGLAIGGAIGGRVADRVARPLRLYGLLELVIAVIVILTPLSFRLIGEAYRGVYPLLAEAPLGLALVRFGLAILALAPATLLMGATLPTLTRYLTAGGAGIAGSFRRLYLANTVGAVVGTFLAGFVLIEILGLTGALLIGVVASSSAGVLALALDRTYRREIEDEGLGAGSMRGAGRTSPNSGSRRTRRLALMLAFVSGLTSLGYQVVWNRLVSTGTGSSTYVFTIILVLFLIGIAIGAGMLQPLRARVRSPAVLIGGAQLATAGLALAGALVLAAPAAPISASGPQFALSLAWFAAGAVFVVLPATVALGITFPATAALLGDETGSEGTAAGLLLAVNTTGSIVATFALPFFIIPWIGSPATLAALVACNVLVGIGLLGTRAEVPVSRRAAGSAAGAILLAAIALAAATGTAFRNPTVELIEQASGQVFEATEDEIAAVEAGQVRARPQLWVGGTSMTLITVDTKFMPLLPLALRPEADRGLVIAFGMGTSFRTALAAGVRTDAVELVPSVPSMFRWFYQDADAVAANPNGRIIVADGRNHVELSSDTYDFIIVDPPPPIETSGVSVISTMEFYEASKRRLVEDGVMVQWVPYGQSLDEFLAHARSFLAVFPNVRIIAGSGGFGLYMIGSDGSVELDAAAIRSVLERPGVLDDVNEAPDADGRSAQAWGERLMALTWAAGPELRAAVGDGPLVTDDRPLPEYFILRRLAEPDEERLTLEGLRALLQ